MGEVLVLFGGLAVVIVVVIVGLVLLQTPITLWSHLRAKRAVAQPQAKTGDHIFHEWSTHQVANAADQMLPFLNFTAQVLKRRVKTPQGLKMTIQSDLVGRQRRAGDRVQDCRVLVVVNPDFKDFLFLCGDPLFICRDTRNNLVLERY